jgi:hypothetical protein
MNILETTEKLLSFYEKKDHFEIEKNFKEIVLVSDNQKADKATVLCALEELEKMELVRSKEIEDKKYYILSRDMESFEQNVTISYQTAVMISTVVNTFCTKIDDKQDWCDIKNIGERDVRNAAIVAKHYEEQIDKVMDMSEGDPGP